MSPEQTAKLTALTIAGQPTRAIGQALGVSHVTVAAHQKRPEVRAYIEQEISALMQRGLKPARKTLCRLAAEGIKTTDKEMLNLSLKASQVILQHANGQPGTIINALIQVNNAPEHSQELATIAGYLSQVMAGDMTDLQSETSHLKSEIPDQNGGVLTSIATSHTAPDCLKTDTPIDVTPIAQDTQSGADHAPVAPVSVDNSQDNQDIPC